MAICLLPTVWISFAWWKKKQQLTLFIISTEHGWVQKQSWTETNVMPACSQCSDVSIIWLESKEWMKFGGKAFFCFITFGFLLNHQEETVLPIHHFCMQVILSFHLKRSMDGQLLTQRKQAFRFWSEKTPNILTRTYPYGHYPCISRRYSCKTC